METVAAVSEDTDDRIQCIQHLLNYGASAHIQNKVSPQSAGMLNCKSYKGYLSKENCLHVNIS